MDAPLQGVALIHPEEIFRASDKATHGYDSDHQSHIAQANSFTRHYAGSSLRRTNVTPQDAEHVIGSLSRCTCLGQLGNPDTDGSVSQHKGGHHSSAHNTRTQLDANVHNTVRRRGKVEEQKADQPRRPVHRHSCWPSLGGGRTEG